MAVICSCEIFWRILMRHGMNITARKTRIRGTASGMRHGYKEERILVGCEDVSCWALSLSLFSLSVTMPDLLMKKWKRHNLPFSAVM
jgi:hypothetical protein